MNGDEQRIELEILVLRCQRGDREAFERLVREWERKLFFYIRRLVADEETAWQILQDVWVQVLRNIRTLREPTRLPVWLYAVTRNTIMSHHREAYSRERAMDSVDDHDHPVEDDHTPLEDADLIHHGLSRIPRADREVLTLYFLKELAIDDVAEVLGIPPGTVKSRLFKARKSLRKTLQAEGASDD